MFDFIQNLAISSGAVGAAGFFLGGIVEEVALPFPSPLLLTGAAIFVKKSLSLVILLKMYSLVILPIAFGASLGSLLLYGLCYSGGKVVIEKLSKWTRFTWADVERIRTRFAAARSDEWLLFITRCIPFGPTKIFNAAAGVVRMNPVAFFVIILAGNVVKISLLFFGLLAFGDTILKL